MRKLARNISFIILLIITLYLISSLIEVYKLRSAQEKLAIEFGVTIENYPHPEFFPEHYFYQVLKPGMSITTVHEIVTGYELVYTCGFHGEVYYYFSKNDKKALRFEILYDRSWNYYSLRGEDEDSSSIFIENCEEGSIEIP